MGLLWGTMLGTPWPRPMNVHEMQMNTTMYHAWAENSGCPALSNGIMHARTPNVNRMPFETD
jgi:hypothetical protein